MSDSNSEPNSRKNGSEGRPKGLSKDGSKDGNKKRKQSGINSFLFMMTLSLCFFSLLNWWFPSTSVESPSKETVQEYVEGEASTAASAEEKEDEFYFLTTDTSRYTFSSRGAALCSVDLPFHSPQHRTSVVRPIELDRIMYAGSIPSNGAYPLLRYARTDEGPLYPEARFRSMALMHGSDPSLANVQYEVIFHDEDSLHFQGEWKGRRITKKFYKGVVPYSLQCTLYVEGDTSNMWVSSGVPEVEPNVKENQVLYLSHANEGKTQNVHLPDDLSCMSHLSPIWVGNGNGFFGLVLYPQGWTRGLVIEKAMIPSRMEMISSRSFPGYNVRMAFPHRQKETQWLLYAGPYEHELLEKVDQQVAQQLGNDPHFSALHDRSGWFSWLVAPFAKLIFALLHFFYAWTRSWGVSILLVTVVFRVLLYPLNAWSMRSTERLQQIQPQIERIKKKYNKDSRKQMEAQLNLYRQEKVHPLSMIVPTVLQMPFLFGMFRVLKGMFELRGVPLVPGWIDDLSAPDTLFRWVTPLPLIGSAFHFLPLLLGIMTLLQSRMMQPLPKDKSQWTEEQIQKRWIGNLFVVVMMFLFYNMPSGLNIYWISSTILGLLQQAWIKRNPPLSESEDKST